MTTEDLRLGVIRMCSDRNQNKKNKVDVEIENGVKVEIEFRILRSYEMDLIQIKYGCLKDPENYTSEDFKKNAMFRYTFLHACIVSPEMSIEYLKNLDIITFNKLYNKVMEAYMNEYQK